MLSSVVKLESVVNTIVFCRLLQFGNHLNSLYLYCKLAIMPEKNQKRELLKKKLFTKNRLVIVNEDTFEEVFSLRLTLMNVFVVGSLGAIIIIFVTTYIIAFTPLREYIPGYASSKLKRDATELALKSDSLSNALKKNEAYIKSIKSVLTNNLDYEKLSKDSITLGAIIDESKVDLSASEAEVELRKEVDKRDKEDAKKKRPKR